MREKKWIFLEKNADQGVVYALSTVFGISPLLSTVLVNRGLSDAAEAKLFLDRSYAGIHSPFLMKDMEKAVRRLTLAKERHETVTVYGDYDVDGVTATTLLVTYFRYFGLDVHYYIPERQGEGYGVHSSAIDQIEENGTTLIVTVDTGITAVEEVEYAREKGIDVIVTDHHSCKDVLPSAVAVINPKQPGCSYPFKDLAGVGVAFKLIDALSGGNQTKELLTKLGDLVALGTVADVVSLLGENRIFVYYGIKKMNENPMVGMEKIMDVARISDKEITAQQVSFMLAPRVNAAGRMGRAVDAVDLFLTEDPHLASGMARELDFLNRDRQNQEGDIMRDAQTMIETGEYDQDEVLVLAHENWHHGIIGIVASRVADKYNKPAILISLEGENGKGSGRSVGTFNLFQALNYSSGALTKFGGHALAAGLSVKRSMIPKLRKLLNEYAKTHTDDIPEIPEVDVDFVVSGKAFQLTTVQELRMLEPYGMDNRQPLLALLCAEVTQVRTMSEGKHLKITVIHDRKTIEVVGFGMGALSSEISIGDTLDVVGGMETNTYNGVTKVQMRLSDLRFSPEKEKNEYLKYDELQTAYRVLRASYREQPFLLMKKDAARILAGGNEPIHPKKVLAILEVFRDSDLITYTELQEQWAITLNRSVGKIDILSSDRYLEAKRTALYE